MCNILFLLVYFCTIYFSVQKKEPYVNYDTLSTVNIASTDLFFIRYQGVNVSSSLVCTIGLPCDSQGFGSDKFT